MDIPERTAAHEGVMLDHEGLQPTGRSHSGAGEKCVEEEAAERSY